MRKSVNMSDMRRNQQGIISTSVLFGVLLCILLIASIAFGAWAFSGRQTYKNNVDQLITTAVNTAKQQTEVSDATQYAKEAEQPLQTYRGPGAFGSLVLSYPKNWSAYVIESANNGSTPVNGYFQPGFVPDTSNQANAFALRIEVLQQTYDQVVAQYNSQAMGGSISVTPYSLPLVPSVVGVKVSGQLTSTKSGIMVILPIRALTAEIWTEAPQYESDFNTNILPNLSFSP